MQCIRLPKSTDIAERVLPESVSGWMNTKSVQNIDDSFVQNLQGDSLIAWVLGWSKCGMPHQPTFTNFTHWAWAIWDLSNNCFFWIIPDPGCHKRITLSLESIIKIPFEAVTSNVKIPEWGQPSSNCGMPWLLRISGTCQGTRDQPNEMPVANFWCLVEIVSDSTNCDIQCTGMLSARKIVNWVLSDAQMTGTILTPAGSLS